MKRDIRVSLPYFHVAPYVLITTDLIFTTGRRLPHTTPNSCRSASRRRCWTSRRCVSISSGMSARHTAPAARWLREQVASVATA